MSKSRKLGPNDKCICGNGKKYKKCHMFEYKKFEQDNPHLFETLPMNVPKEIIIYAEMETRKTALLKDIGFKLNHLQVEFNGKRARVVFSKITFRPLEETFHEFIIDMLLGVIGPEWVEAQLKLLLDKQHFVAKCFSKAEEWMTKNKDEQTKLQSGRYSGVPDGFTKSLLSLAFDIYCLSHTNKLPDFLIERLKIPQEFQGARYEISIAAIFARLGYEIEFLDTEKLKEKHCEFIATHKESGARICVEAKSRHRKGVLHMPGEMDSNKVKKGDVQPLLNKALEKNTMNLPFLIFIDVNSPTNPQEKIEEKQWLKDVVKIYEKAKRTNPKTPRKYNGVVFTNFSFHYQEEDTSVQAEASFMLENNCLSPLKDPNIIDEVAKAVSKYGLVPDLDR